MDLNQYAFKKLFNQYKRNAKKKNIEFDLSLEEFYVATKGHCYLCGQKPEAEFDNYEPKRIKNKYIYNGIDRVDPTKGYVSGNVKSCCKKCNYMKHTMNLKELKRHLIKIVGNLI